MNEGCFALIKVARNEFMKQGYSTSAIPPVGGGPFSYLGKEEVWKDPLLAEGPLHVTMCLQ